MLFSLKIGYFLQDCRQNVYETRAGISHNSQVSIKWVEISLITYVHSDYTGQPSAILYNFDALKMRTVFGLIKTCPCWAEILTAAISPIRLHLLATRNSLVALTYTSKDWRHYTLKDNIPWKFLSV